MRVVRPLAVVLFVISLVILGCGSAVDATSDAPDGGVALPDGGTGGADGSAPLPTLIALLVSPGKIAFNPTEHSYVFGVPVDTTAVDVTPTLAPPLGTAQINGLQAASGVAQKVAFPPNQRRLTIEVRAPGDPAPYVLIALRDGQQAYIKPSHHGDETSSYFGTSVAMSADGSTLAVGAYFESGLPDGGAAKNGSGAVYVFTRDASAVWTQQAYLRAPDGDDNDYFGISLGLSGDGKTLAVGSWWEDSDATGVGGDPFDDDAPQAGAVYVYDRGNDGTWSPAGFLKASNTNSSDHFGQALALSGDGLTLAVGAPDEDGAIGGVTADGGSNAASQSGAVYVFSRNAGGAWSPEAYLKAAHPTMNDYFGEGISLSANGNVLAVGAYNEQSTTTDVGGDEQSDDTDDYSNRGAAYVFSRDAAHAWSQQAFIKAPISAKNLSFGYAVALSGDGNSLAVGARGESSSATGIDGDIHASGANGSGAVYLFGRDGNTWTRSVYFKASNTSANAGFGIALSLSTDGDTLAVGAWMESELAAQSGAAYVFKRDVGEGTAGAATWGEAAYLKASNAGTGAQFGRAVALSADGTTIAIGANEESGGATGVDGDPNADPVGASGAVYVFGY